MVSQRDHNRIVSWDKSHILFFLNKNPYRSLHPTFPKDTQCVLHLRCFGSLGMHRYLVDPPRFAWLDRIIKVTVCTFPYFNRFNEESKKESEKKNIYIPIERSLDYLLACVRSCMWALHISYRMLFFILYNLDLCLHIYIYKYTFYIYIYIIHNYIYLRIHIILLIT